MIRPFAQTSVTTRLDLIQASHVLEDVSDLGGVQAFASELDARTHTAIDLAWRILTSWGALERTMLPGFRASAAFITELEAVYYPLGDIVSEQHARLLAVASEYPDPAAWLEHARTLDDRVLEGRHDDPDLREALQALYEGLDQAFLFMEVAEHFEWTIPTRLHDSLLDACDFAREAYGLFDPIRQVITRRAEMMPGPTEAHSPWLGSLYFHAELLEQFDEIAGFDDVSTPSTLAPVIDLATWARGAPRALPAIDTDVIVAAASTPSDDASVRMDFVAMLPDATARVFVILPGAQTRADDADVRIMAAGAGRAGAVELYGVRFELDEAGSCDATISARMYERARDRWAPGVPEVVVEVGATRAVAEHAPVELLLDADSSPSAPVYSATWKPGANGPRVVHVVVRCAHDERGLRVDLDASTYERIDAPEAASIGAWGCVELVTAAGAQQLDVRVVARAVDARSWRGVTHIECAEDPSSIEVTALIMRYVTDNSSDAQWRG